MRAGERYEFTEHDFWTAYKLANAEHNRNMGVASMELKRIKSPEELKRAARKSRLRLAASFLGNGLADARRDETDSDSTMTLSTLTEDFDIEALARTRGSLTGASDGLHAGTPLVVQAREFERKRSILGFSTRHKNLIEDKAYAAAVLREKVKELESKKAATAEAAEAAAAAVVSVNDTSATDSKAGGTSVATSKAKEKDVDVDAPDGPRVMPYKTVDFSQ